MIGQEKIRAANFTGLLQPAVLIISLFVFFVVFGEASVDNYIVSMYLSFSAGMLAGMLRHVRYFAGFRAHTLREYARFANGMVRFGILNQVAHVTQMLSFRLSYYVLDHYHGASAVGVYSNGISLAESIWMISKSISMVQYARISNLEDRAESAALTARLASVSAAMSIVTLLPLLLLPSGFYVMLFGEGFEGTKSVIWTLALGVVVYNFPILIGHYFSGTGRYRINALISSVGLIVSAALYLGMIPRMGLTGAGIATSVSYLFTSLLFIIWFSKEYNEWPRMFLPRKADISALLSGIKKIIGDRKESGR
jgi:O-antigen/teichoic acid export membrane protein